MKYKNIVALTIIGALLFFSLAKASTVNYKLLDPLQTVRTLVVNTVNQIKTLKSENPDFSHRSLRNYIKTEALPQFDLRSITKSLMGEYYSRATDSQQDQFTDAFADRLLQIYSNSLKNLDRNKIQFTRNFQYLSNGRALVRTLLVTENNTRVPIEYYLREATNIGWLIYDIHIDGMSVIATYRPTFKKQFDSKPIDQVIKDLNTSNAYIDQANDKQNN